MIKNNKVLTRVLLLVVAVIYGTIAYKSYAGQKIADENLASGNFVTNFMPVNYRKDTFNLEFPINDPFAGTYAFTKQNPNPMQQSNQNPALTKFQQGIIKPPPVPIKWPEVKYLGFVKNTSKTNPLCLLSFDGGLVKKTKMQSHQNILIMAVYRDSVILKLKDSFKTVLKGG